MFENCYASTIYIYLFLHTLHYRYVYVWNMSMMYEMKKNVKCFRLHSLQFSACASNPYDVCSYIDRKKKILRNNIFMCIVNGKWNNKTYNDSKKSSHTAKWHVISFITRHSKRKCIHITNTHTKTYVHRHICIIWNCNRNYFPHNFYISLMFSIFLNVDSFQ